jgi:hypothetical protein
MPNSNEGEVAITMITSAYSRSVEEVAVAQFKF